MTRLQEIAGALRAARLDMTIEDGRAMVSGEPRQRQVVAIL